MSIRDAVLRDIRDERERQYTIHSQTCREMARSGDFGACLAVLMEEVGEVARALNDSEPTDQLRAELVQVAASAVAWVEGLVAGSRPDTPDWTKPDGSKPCPMSATNAAARPA